MEDQYGMADLGQYMNGRDLFPPQQDSCLLSSHQGLSPPNLFDMIMFRSDNTAAAAIPKGGTTCGGGEASASAAAGGGLSRRDGGDVVAGRWPRQETLTLLDIRSRLDSKFKVANQKGPLWDEVSRIMSEEHAYQRSGKKCREKFENLYKYYKKTKEGKAGKQDGRHYRFFRQLEALYGETNNSASVSETLFHGSFNPNVPKISTLSANNQESCPGFKISDTSLSLSNYCDFDPTSSDDSENNPGIDGNNSNKRKGIWKRGWKVRIKDLIDAQMKKLIDKQEAWMEKTMKTIEDREKERIRREEEWRKQHAEKMEKQHDLWASERAWIEARDASLMDTLHKITRKESRDSQQEEVMATDVRSLSENYHNDDGSDTMTNSLTCDVFWPECEVSRLIQLRNGMESKFQQSGISEEVLWEEIATKMACFGYDKSGLSCIEKWDSINNNVLIKCNKKRKDNSTICSNHQNYESMCNQGGGSYCDNTEFNRDDNSPVETNNTGNGMSDTCLRYYMGDMYGRLMVD